MQLINEHHTFTGMQKDLSKSKHPASLLYDARNIRLSTVGDSTLLAITNEKGTSGRFYNLRGTYLGHCLLDKYLVIFLKAPSGYSAIVRIFLPKLIEYLEGGTVSSGDIYKNLYAGNLGFDINYPIEAIGFYENEEVQKVYWTDGLNQPRVINIVDSRMSLRSSSSDYYPWNETSFDFVPSLQLNESVSVTKKYGGGTFAAGVIQYAFTYYNQYGQESNIFYTSTLRYISPPDRGASPEERVSNSFDIVVDNVDTNFDYLRIYSIQRTSINSTPICKRVLDLKVADATDGTLKFTDTGEVGDSIDPMELLYKGGEDITALTIELKDNTLFLGNIKINRESNLSSLFVHENPTEDLILYPTLSTSTRSVAINSVSTSGYAYYNQLKNEPCCGFKKGNYYRLGVLFQHKSGKWSEPIFLEDKLLNKCPSESGSSVLVPSFEGTVAAADAIKLMNMDYKKVRGVVVFPSESDRVVVCLGVLNPTVFTTLHRTTDKSLYALSSWFFRPIPQGCTWTSGIGSSNINWFPVTGNSLDNSGQDTGTPNLTVSPSFFGPNITGSYSDGSYSANGTKYLPYTSTEVSYDPSKIRAVEIQGQFNDANKFLVDFKCSTLHSPDLVFDELTWNYDYSTKKYRYVGRAEYTKTLSYIDIITDTPPIYSNGLGFTNVSYSESSSKGIISGLFYDDCIVDDNSNGDFEKYPAQKVASKWMVYPWQKEGSLNNDILRPANKGVQSAKILKKILSNLRYATTKYQVYTKDNSTYVPIIEVEESPVSESYSETLLGAKTINDAKIFSSDTLSILKLNNTGITESNIYLGNIDTMLSPDTGYPLFLACAKGGTPVRQGITFNTTSPDLLFGAYIKTGDIISENGSNNTTNKARFYIWNFSSSTTLLGTTTWSFANDGLWHSTKDYVTGDKYIELGVTRQPIRMKYKSTPHIAIVLNGYDFINSLANHTFKASQNNYYNIIAEIVNPGDSFVSGVSENRTYKRATMFGGTSNDALAANVWVPCGHPVSLNQVNTSNVLTNVPYHYWYGDTYFQRWDCMKTYPFTSEDTNLIVEIGSFMLETYVNIEGRYDRNRGQLNNTRMSPLNFNLLNPVYSLVDNFFSYKILSGEYGASSFPNLFTWSKEKQAGASIDAWTNTTLASTYDVDGTKGLIRSLNTYQDNIYCFQDKGISTILFNSRVQIPTSDGVPIEISNSYKVDGYRYISDGIGCTNKWSIKETPSGIYFIDATSKHLYHIGEGLNDISTTCNMNSWFFDNNIKRTFYDNVNHDLYLQYETTVNNNPSDAFLCYSEPLQLFTSFMDYNDVSILECYKDNTIISQKNTMSQGLSTIDCVRLHEMFKGDYNNIFGNYKDWYFQFVSNGIQEGVTDYDKTYSTIDYRMDITNSSIDKPYNATLTHILVENEYQLTAEVPLKLDRYTTTNRGANLSKKFRIWRIQIPRAMEYNTTNLQWYFTKDRIRNPWCTIKLKCEGSRQQVVNGTTTTISSGLAILHDLNVQYFV